jgi:F5/8 type C domain-containing protein
MRYTNASMEILRRALDRFRSGGGTTNRDSALAPERVDPELQRRGCLALELARRTLVEPVEHGPADAVGCELYCQAIYWGLLARRPADSGDTERAALADVFADSEPALLERCAGGAEQAASLGARLEQASFSALADLPESERASLLGDVRRFADNLLYERDTELERVWTRRLLWTSAAAVLIATAIVASPRLLDLWEAQRDLAQNKPWTASSRAPDSGCQSPAQRCPESPDFFFHTNKEQSPWLAIDLESVQTISSLRVRNRRGCCLDRAVPLVVETSVDQQKWTEVARNEEEFGEWKASFTPTQARWVRLRVPRKTWLHLRRVRVLP